MTYGRIEINPQIMAGKPVIKGTRIPVYLILDFLAEGKSFDQIVKAYPDLVKEDIEAALHYAVRLVKYEEESLAGV